MLVVVMAVEVVMKVNMDVTWCATLGSDAEAIHVNRKTKICKLNYCTRYKNKIT